MSDEKLQRRVVDVVRHWPQGEHCTFIGIKKVLGPPGVTKFKLAATLGLLMKAGALLYAPESRSWSFVGAPRMLPDEYVARFSWPRVA